ncbi:MBL fold metallo-hydrolase [Deinococcus lacus]|uniref:MBL fold metallo-hydrolase n=1 Tax=Deinococcus lacus TaxID=392561 RepID=A0ABW1YI45_9DEIO
MPALPETPDAPRPLTGLTPATLDLHFLGNLGAVASYAFDTGDGLALVDTGPSTTLEALKSGLKAHGARLEDVRHILLTHIHLDHAGAAGTLLEELPQARLYVHARGAAHLLRPGRLLSSAAHIYGDRMESLWGEMRPVTQDRLTALEESSTLRLGRTEVRALPTPGHAVHHLSFVAGEELYAGDVGGIRVAQEQQPTAPTPPPDIDLAAWENSAALLRGLDVRWIHLAHFGTYAQEAAHWDGLMDSLHRASEIVGRGLEAGASQEDMTRHLTEALYAGLDAGLVARLEATNPAWMNVQGLTRAWQLRKGEA